MIMEAANVEMEKLRADLSAEKRELLMQLQETQKELEESNAARSASQDEIFTLRQTHEETLVAKEKRIAHLEQSKLTQVSLRFPVHYIVKVRVSVFLS